MRSRESSLWEWLSRANKTPSRLHMCRVENVVMPGYPDLEGCFNGVGFWIELKVTIGNRIDITPDQVMWLKRRWAVGGCAWVLVYWRGERWLVRGIDSQLLLGTEFEERFGVIVDTPHGAILAATSR